MMDCTLCGMGFGSCIRCGRVWPEDQTSAPRQKRTLAQHLRAFLEVIGLGDAQKQPQGVTRKKCLDRYGD